MQHADPDTTRSSMLHADQVRMIFIWWVVLHIFGGWYIFPQVYTPAIRFIWHVWILILHTLI